MHTRAHTPKQEPSLLRSQCGFVPSVKFFLFRHTFIYIHFPVLCEPHYISRGKNSGKVAAISFIPNRFSFRFSTSRTNGSRSLSQTKASTHSAFGEKSHTTAYAAKQGRFGWGCCHSRHEPHVPKPPLAGYQNGKLCRFWVLVRCTPEARRRRGPAGLRDLFLLLSKLQLARPALRAFCVCEVGMVSLPSVCSACCQSVPCAGVKTANLPISEVG